MRVLVSVAWWRAAGGAMRVLSASLVLVAAVLFSADPSRAEVRSLQSMQLRNDNMFICFLLFCAKITFGKLSDGMQSALSESVFM